MPDASACSSEPVTGSWSLTFTKKSQTSCTAVPAQQTITQYLLDDSAQSGWPTPYCWSPTNRLADFLPGATYAEATCHVTGTVSDGIADAQLDIHIRPDRLWEGTATDSTCGISYDVLGSR